jgi:uncharacterized protein
MSLHPILTEKLNFALDSANLAPTTRRDIALPPIRNKAHAVIGMRRAGKTTFLQQLQSDQRALEPKAAHKTIYLSFDDDRLADLDHTQLSELLEEYFRRYPEFRNKQRCVWYLDEIQLVAGWERFVRRVLDTEQIDIVVSGSSARMLSREVHTSLRGRGIETIVRPFSFREYLRHHAQEPQKPIARLKASERSAVEKSFLLYLQNGGFPEVQGLTNSLRTQLLQGYVDTVIFRDIIERYQLSQIAALRWLTRQCLRNPASLISLSRFHLDLKAQGHGTSKDTLYAVFDHLLDSFLIEAIPIATESERRLNSNPRKIYPIDTGLIAAFDQSGRSNVGHSLEVMVQGELQRRGATLAYVKTRRGFEVDFLARFSNRGEQLIQVCADLSNANTLQREIRALEDASLDYPNAEKLILVLYPSDVLLAQAAGVQALTAWAWALEQS